jgi:hypothetical protein
VGDTLVAAPSGKPSGHIMLLYIKRVVLQTANTLVSTPLDVSRTEWIFIFFGVLVIGFLCLRSTGRR